MSLSLLLLLLLLLPSWRRCRSRSYCCCRRRVSMRRLCWPSFVCVGSGWWVGVGQSGRSPHLSKHAGACIVMPSHGGPQQGRAGTSSIILLACFPRCCCAWLALRLSNCVVLLCIARTGATSDRSISKSNSPNRRRGHSNRSRGMFVEPGAAWNIHSRPRWCAGFLPSFPPTQTRDFAPCSPPPPPCFRALGRTTRSRAESRSFETSQRRFGARPCLASSAFLIEGVVRSIDRPALIDQPVDRMLCLEGCGGPARFDRFD